MIIATLSVLCLGLGLAALALQRLYSSVPAHELKRLSKRGDVDAQMFYRAVAYGRSLRILLWVVTTTGCAAGLVLLAAVLPLWVVFLLASVVLGLAFTWLPSLHLTPSSVAFARWCSPGVVFLLRHLYPVLRPAAGLAKKRQAAHGHSRMYEKEDLVRLLERQKEQPDNRIDHEDLELACRALVFSGRQAADIAMPRRQLHLVNADDTVGPILLDQMHKSGQSIFLVYKDTPETVVGSVSLKSAVAAKQGGRVMDLVHPDLAFVHEDLSLYQVLQTFRQTLQEVVVVINSFDELVGSISQQQLLGELLGEQPEDPASSPEALEVVE